MTKKWKILLIVSLLVIVAGAAVAFYMWNKPQRNVENEKGIALTASQLVKEFQENEQQANAKYLDKAIEVRGVVAETGQNQEGITTVTLSSDDAFTGVFCTLKENTEVAAGSNITIRGICSGMLSDVRLSEAIIVK